VVRVGATIAALGSFLSLVAGISRTAFAMASNGALPHWLAAVHPRFKVPHHAELLIGAITLVVVSFGGVTRHAAAFPAGFEQIQRPSRTLSALGSSSTVAGVASDTGLPASTTG